MNAMTKPLNYLSVLIAVLVAAMDVPTQAQQPSRVRDRLWIWGHPAGVYNASYLAPLGKESTIEPVAAADTMGIHNMIFVRYQDKPRPPFEKHYEPFKKLDRVYWSLVGAGGATSEDERRHVIRLAEQTENIAGFILDDFFHARPRMWLAANHPRFPVTLTITPPVPTSCQHVELIQTDWRTGDYRSKDVAIEVSTDGQQFTLVQAAELPNEAGKSLRITLPTGPFRVFRVQVRSTHDTKGAISCGLKAVRFLRDGQPVDLQNWKAGASSTYPGFAADGVLEDGERFSASLSPEQLHALGERHYRGKKLPITAVVYARQISPWLKPYLDEVDQVSLWTWRPADLDRVTENLTALEKLVPGRPVLLGCYMYDFDQRKSLPVERMKMQVELGYRWLREGRIAGMIFLATPNVDVGLEAVEWTREWIVQVGDEKLK
ncbi:MAG: hypothetical protein H8E44_44190 [Planctomycetes bacterium]|nr:hypothetical protein [Planctomycetota bacterium]MBL7043994.1 hypothetical protein [Pirellulaceae bacterium]